MRLHPGKRRRRGRLEIDPHEKTLAVAAEQQLRESGISFRASSRNARPPGKRPAPIHSKYEVTSPSMVGRIGPDGLDVHLRRRHPQNGPRQLLRRRQVEEAVDVGQVAAIELVELDAVGGIVLRTVPPAPVAALGDQQFLERQLPLLLRDAGGGVVGLRARAAVASTPGCPPRRRSRRRSWR